MTLTQAGAGVVCYDPGHHWILHDVIETAIGKATGKDMQLYSSTSLLLT